MRRVTIKSKGGPSRRAAEKISLNDLFPKRDEAILVRAQETPLVQPSPDLPPALDPVASFRWGWYAMAALIPFAGILIGLFLYDQGERSARLVGRNSLLIGFTLWVVLPLCLGFLLLALFSLSAMGWVSSLMPPTP